MGQDEDYLGALIEDMDDRFDLILELLDSLKDLPIAVKNLQDRMQHMEHQSDLYLKALKEQGWTLKDHEGRLTQLETA